MNQVKPLGKVEANSLADFILKHYGPMSHLKLQKLLYYCEAYHLAYFDESLMPQEFEAWLHGPVCREVYNQLKGASILYSDISFDPERIPDPDAIINKSLSSDQHDLVGDVLNQLSKWSAFELERATHKEAPWINARKGYGPADRCEEIISKDLMRVFYKEELNL